MTGPSPLTYLSCLVLIIVVVALVAVVAPGVYLWRKRRSKRVGCDKYGKVVMNCMCVYRLFETRVACCHCTVRFSGLHV